MTGQHTTWIADDARGEPTLWRTDGHPLQPRVLMCRHQAPEAFDYIRDLMRENANLRADVARHGGRQAETQAALDEARAELADTTGGRRVARLHEIYDAKIRDAFVGEAAALARAEAAESVVAAVRALLTEAERQTALSLSCDINGNRWQTPIMQADLRAALATPTIELASLPRLWDEESGGGEEISFTALEAARELLRAAQPEQDSAPGIFPIESGGVLLEWTVPTRVTSVEISPDETPEFVVHTFALEPRRSTELTTTNLAEATTALLEALG